MATVELSSEPLPLQEDILSIRIMANHPYIIPWNDDIYANRTKVLLNLLEIIG